MKKILVTGSAGFIGANLVLRLFKELQEATIVGLDNMNSYYDPTLKDYRLSVIGFIAWLCGQTKVYAWEMPGRRYDIGNLESYEEVKKTFSYISSIG